MSEEKKTPIVLSPGDSQVVWYAKNWFVPGPNYYEDVRQIICRRNALAEVSDRDVVETLVCVLEACGVWKGSTVRTLTNLLIFGDISTIVRDKRTQVEKFIDYALGQLSVLPMKDFVTNGTIVKLEPIDPDYGEVKPKYYQWHPRLQKDQNEEA